MQELSADEKIELAGLLVEKEERIKYNVISTFSPYKFQKKFYAAGAKYKHRLLMAANRVGKSFCGAQEVSFHATGQYPPWWKGRRFKHAVKIIVGGQTTERTRDITQKELLGEPADPAAFGSGSIPRDAIVSRTRRPGIPNAVSAVLVKHVSGDNSKVVFQSYESGKEAWMGDNAHFIWLDEEPPSEIHSQALRAMVDLDGDLMMTFTPENGVTDIVRQYLQELKEHQYLQNATWDDAPHITESVKKQMFDSMRPHERDMRMKGLPMVGQGLVYSLDEALLSVDPIQIPEHWRRISGIDFGFNHPTAWVNIAYDADADIIYVTEAVKIKRTIIMEVASQLKHKGANKVPVAWPHDGLKHDPTSGRTVRDIYEQEGLKMLPEKFSNPPSPGMNEGTGGIGIEAGVAALINRMETDRFKVFSTCTEWFEEFRLYHRKNGKIHDRFDDLMSATRYAAQSLRFARASNSAYRVSVPKINDFSDAVIGY